MHATTEKRARRRLGSERGQAMVEFAIIAPLFVALVAGVIQFGVALNFWLDMQRIANQGARWAVVNRYPIADAANADYPACTQANAPCAPTLQGMLSNEKIAKGEVITPYVCFPANSGPSGTPTVGDPVMVRMERDFQFVPIIRVGSIKLRASATMRLEQKPTVFGSDGACP